VLQRSLNGELRELNLLTAVVIRNHRMAYLADVVFGDGDHKIFYDDIDVALHWLQEQP
jgi:hypothetical protein